VHPDINGFSCQFGHYIPPSPDAIKQAMVGGMIVLDTNVLLSAYRFAPQHANN
jgi:hypothetical protein